MAQNTGIRYPGIAIPTSNMYRPRFTTVHPRYSFSQNAVELVYTILTPIFTANLTAGQPIGVTVHFTQQPIREQLLSSQPRQKLLKNHHPDKAQKPRLPDPIVQPIVIMPLSRTYNTTFVMPLIEDLS
ncbi:hypothetical protein TNCV_2519481 [Trichonephila clavipes]|nr:hypothetical protein TNCV_2519481 [Trichonephila clavipes]